MTKFKEMCESMLNFFGKKFDWFEETNIPITEEKPKVDKLIKKDKKKIDKMMTTLVKKDIPRDKKIKKCDKVMKKKKVKE